MIQRLSDRHGINRRELAQFLFSAPLVFALLVFLAGGAKWGWDQLTKPSGPVTKYVSFVPVDHLGIPRLFKNKEPPVYLFAEGEMISAYSSWLKLRDCRTLHIERFARNERTGDVHRAAQAKGLQSKSGNWADVTRVWFPDGLPAGAYTMYKHIRSWCSEAEPDQEPVQTAHILVISQ